MTTRRQRDAIEQIEWMRSLLALLLVGAFIGAMGMFTFVALPGPNKDIITYMVGQLSGMALTVLGFFFVNNVGKDALDAKRTENTGKAFEAVSAVAGASPTTDIPQPVVVVNEPNEPVPTTEGEAAPGPRPGGE